MAGGLPPDLVEQTALTLSSVSRVTLPPERWPAVERALSAVDHAVDTDNADALGYALDELHRIGLSPPILDDDCPTGASPVVDPPQPGGAPPPFMGYPPQASGHGAPPPSMSYPPQQPSTDYGGPPPTNYLPQAAGYGAPPSMGYPQSTASRSTRRWIWLGGGVLAIALLLAFGILSLMTSTHNAAGPATRAPSPSRSAAPTSVTSTDTPTQAGGGTGVFVAVGLLAVAGAVIAVVIVLMRRRSRTAYPPPMHLAAEPIARPERLAATFAPNELVELANRTVDRLVDKGGRR
ncbi:CATRA system-associated protein [Mycobacterium paraterrae]|uniref:Transmembrane protein n=1 Tax=Mycobacterium paraterrae TaxID=577492 RepID=A0ABY3VM98_9MYCO|nr:CATRA system-associated protein [Mycobacterium paraterrae]UMB68281.1 hypothetical protein MKK62_17800 [Mycobacterium paraterrae]